jgi:hypothetical protein
MPQFDKITFFTQIFWLTIIFFGFYFFMLQIFLPKIASVLKTRKKKLSVGARGVFDLNKEQFSVLNFRNAFMQNFASNAKNNVVSVMTDSISWLLLSVLNTNTSDLAEAQSSYLANSGDIFAKLHSDLDSF